MARKNVRSRLYRRDSGRYYADLRAYSDVGGTREPLIPPGESRATRDREVAEVMLAARIKQLEGARRDRTLLGYKSGVQLADYARHHLIETKRAGKVGDKWIGESEHRLRRAIEFFGSDKQVAAITPRDVQDWINWLREIPSPRGGTLSDSTVRLHLAVLSKMFRRARSEEVVPSGYNPVSDVIDPPTPTRGEAHFLDLHDAALLLEAARRYVPYVGKHGHWLGEPLSGRMMHAIVGTLLLTGGRLREVLGLEVEDVSFDREKITFRPNAHRGLKNRNASRTIPLFPQLAEILSAYLTGTCSTDDSVVGQIVPGDRVLFPSPRTGGMIHDIRTALDRIAESAGWKEGEIRPHALRHTFCAHRLQCLDKGAPISPYTVGKQLGHGGSNLVERIYGHLGNVRLRSEHLEYRVADHQEALHERLEALGWKVA